MLELAPWNETSFAILEACNSAAMTEHLGGPESPEKLANRFQRYLGYVGDDSGAWAFRLLLDGVGIGSLGYWSDEQCYEMGWAVIPEYQGRGLARAGVELVLDDAARRGGFTTVIAHPSVTNLASNALAKSAGFTLIGEEQIEYPKGTFVQANRWSYDLAKRQRGSH